MCDATEGVTAEDLRIADLAMRNGCATLVLLNKWDVTQTDLEDAKDRVAEEAAPATAGADGVRDQRPERDARCWSRPWRWQIAPAPGSRPRS